MIISQTPHRVSFFGGGTDYPSHYLNHGGRVLGAAIDKYCYLSVRHLPPFFEHKHRIVYSKSENVSLIHEIQHPSVRAVLEYLNIDTGISIHHDGDIPARSGMGSSSSFTVGLLKSMLALQGEYISDRDLAKQAIHIEQNIIRENVGSQDQTFAAYGGLNTIDFLPNGEISVQPVILPPERLSRFERSLMLVFTGLSRISSSIAEEQVQRTELNTKNLHDMKALVSEAHDVLCNDKCDLRDFGKLLNETWRIKRSLSSKVTNPTIDSLYETAIKTGAIGGKLLGAGGGGFMLFFVDPERKSRLRGILNGFLEVPFKFDYGGSKIIVYQPNS